MQNRLLVLAGALIGLMVTGVSVSADVQNEHSDLTIIEGDIFIGRTSSLDPSGHSLDSEYYQSRGLSLTNRLSLWPNGIAVYEIDSDLSSFGETAVKSAIQYWNTHSSISLVERTDPAAPQIDDYISFVDGPGCASWVGRQGQAQEIWVSEFCTTGSMIHEIGHALGLLHEHTRSDRDQFVQVLWDNIDNDKAFNFDVNQAGTQDLGPYDYDSIMHYGEYFFSSNGNPTLAPINAPEGVVIGQRERLSKGDLAAIDALYGTDLSLRAESSQQESNYQLTVMITNEGQKGAQQVVVSMAGNGAITSFASVNSWSCENSGSNLVCQLALLESGSTTTLELYADTELAVEDLTPALTSKTHDLDLRNNGYIVSDGNLQVAAAIGGDGAAGSGNSGGGGALDFRVLIALLLLVVIQYRWTVIRSRRQLEATHTDEYSDLSTPSGGTPRRVQTLSD